MTYLLSIAEPHTEPLWQSYREAQADAVPPYWETVVHAPGFGLDSDMLIDDLPAGSFTLFLGNLAFSFFFQFVGFLLSYLLHTSHAAKFGSRAGLGLTLIRYGYFSRAALDGETGSNDILDDSSLIWPGDQDDDTNNVRRTLMSTAPPAPTPTDENNTMYGMGGVSTREWISFLLMTIGWFLLLSSSVGFWRIKRWERSIRSSSPDAPVTRADIERDIAVRRNIEAVFGFGGPQEPNGHSETQQTEVVTLNAGNLVDTARREVQLRNDLRAAGLL